MPRKKADSAEAIEKNDIPVKADSTKKEKKPPKENLQRLKIKLLWNFYRIRKKPRLFRGAAGLYYRGHKNVHEINPNRIRIKWKSIVFYAALGILVNNRFLLRSLLNIFVINGLFYQF